MISTAWPLGASIGALLAGAVVILIAGKRLVRSADLLADRTGWGEAVFGAIFLGASTSLAGIVASVAAAWDGHPQLAASNAIGGIAAQTVFIVFADLAYRKANLEHAAASAASIMQGVLLVTLLAGVLFTTFTPEVTILGVHPFSPLQAVAYILALRMIARSHGRPMWRPRMTDETRDEGDQEQDPEDDAISTSHLWRSFFIWAPVVAVSGWIVAQAAVNISRETAISETVTGGLFAAVATSLPELVAAIAAVRRGALTLAISDIVGGNAFDTLFLAASDVAFRDGSLYHAITADERALVALTLVMTGVFLMGMMRREKHGAANIGFEGVITIALYLVGFAIVMM